MIKRMTITLFICIVISLPVVGFIIYKDIKESSIPVKEQTLEKVTEQSN